jgi:hypothetical protein
MGRGGSRKGAAMPLYMSTFDYEPAVWAELINNPENRTETVSPHPRGRRLQAEGPLVRLRQERRLRPDRGTGQRDECQHRDRHQRERSLPQVRDDRPRRSLSTSSPGRFRDPACLAQPGVLGLPRQHELRRTGLSRVQGSGRYNMSGSCACSPPIARPTCTRSPASLA